MQHWNDALAVMPVGRRDIDRQREAVLVHGEMDFDALDLLAAIGAAAEASRRRMTGAAVEDDGAGLGSIVTSLPPSTDQAVEQAAPQAKPGANSVYSVPNGMSHSWPMARHCMPQNATHQIAMIALRSAAPVNGGFGPERVRRVPSAAMAASSASTASTKASTSENASHEAGEVLAGLKAVPICCGSGGCCDGCGHSPSPSRASAPIHLKVASRKAPARTPRLPTDSQPLRVQPVH